jgi:hypothetical protein
MVKLISALGFLATLTQLLAVLHNRRVAGTWRIPDVGPASILDTLLFQFVAVPLGFLGLVLGIAGLLMKWNHWGTRRAIGLATALCFIGMIPFGMFKCTWHGVWEKRVREYDATHR